MLENPRLRLFALNASGEFGGNVAAALDMPLSEHEEREFEDGEHKIRPLENVRGADVFVIHSLVGDDTQSVNDKFIRLLFMLGAVRDAAAARVTAVVPYLCYMRKDRKTQPRDPLSTRYIAQLFEAVGVDRIITLDVHNLAAYQNAFRCGTEHLEAKNIFIKFIAPMLHTTQVAVVSPDVGGIKRAELFRQTLEKQLQQPVSAAFMEKQRSGGEVSGNALVGNVEGKTVIIVDDMIASGTTLSRVAGACRERGATSVLAAASHGVFTTASNDNLNTPDLDRIIVTNTVPPLRLRSSELLQRLTVLNIAPLFAEAIKRIHYGGSIVELLSS
jgi:ribose-phosphate pyrophosphokinase